MLSRLFSCSASLCRFFSRRNAHLEVASRLLCRRRRFNIVCAFDTANATRSICADTKRGARAIGNFCVFSQQEKCVYTRVYVRVYVIRTRMHSQCVRRGARRVCHTWHTFAGKRAILLETVFTGSTTRLPSTSRHPLCLLRDYTRACTYTCIHAYTRARAYLGLGCVCAKSREPRPLQVVLAFKRRL